MRILVAALLLVVACHALDSEESADRDDFYDSRGESNVIIVVVAA
jgi:hypothetical protein